jgi:hypothetical protein
MTLWRDSERLTPATRWSGVGCSRSHNSAARHRAPATGSEAPNGALEDEVQVAKLVPAILAIEGSGVGGAHVLRARERLEHVEVARLRLV